MRAGALQVRLAGLPADTAATPKDPIRWNIYKLAGKAVWLGVVEAPDEATAMENAAAQFKVAATRLMAIGR
jgi:hypothetical protein